jgi:hypothetical protein
VSDRRHALATRFTPRRRLRAIYSASRLRDRADDALATRRFFFFFHEDETDATPPLPVFYARRRDYDLIRRECALLRTEVGSERRACARQRLGVMVDPTHVVHRAFMNRKVADRLGALTGESSLLPADVPVEFRVYPSGSCMDWHQDVALYVEPQYELVFTLENSSDSQTQWQDDAGRRRGGWTEPNSVLMVRAEHVVHRVTPVTRGERSIVKFVYTTTLDKTDEFYDNLTTYER